MSVAGAEVMVGLVIVIVLLLAVIGFLAWKLRRSGKPQAVSPPTDDQQQPWPEEQQQLKSVD